MRWLVAAGLVGAAVLVGAAPSAEANGRAPGTSSIRFRRGHDADILAGMTYGLLVSHDSGTTWHWMCEDAIGYSGTYDPRYVYAASGSIFATTFDGIKAMRDGCTFQLLYPPVNFFSAVSDDANGKLFFAAAQTASGMTPGNSGIYSSTDDGVTVSAPATPEVGGSWWSSLEVAPSNTRRIFASGFRYNQGERITFAYRSDDGGATFQALSTAGISLMSSSELFIAAISSTNPDLVYARVEKEDNVVSDALYRSLDAGATWTRIYARPGAITALLRSNGELVAGVTRSGMLEHSTDMGATWSPLANAPHVNCLMENAAHEVWACTEEGTGAVPVDRFAIMKTADLATWTGVLKRSGIQSPVACDAGTVQHDTCDRPANRMFGWCGLCAQLGCRPGADYECAAPAVDAPPGVDAPIVVGGDGGTGSGKGCCDTGASGGPGALVLGTGVALVLAMRRRRG